MLKRYTFWLWTAVGFMFLTGAIHSISLFGAPVAKNEVEQELLHLMTTYKADLGGGFHPTMANLFTALSSCFTFLCFLGGLTIGYLLKTNVPVSSLRGVVRIHLLVFGACFIMMAVFTFLPPIVLTGLVVLFLTLSLITFPTNAHD